MSATKKSHFSPSGKYRLDTSFSADTGFGRTEASIFRVSDEHLIYSIKDVPLFRFQFFQKNSQEWLYSGAHYMLQLFINLDTCEVFDDTGKIKETEEFKNGTAFCWGSIDLTKDGNTLIVDGCVWGWPYEIKFFDFSDPKNGWPELNVYDEVPEEDRNDDVIYDFFDFCYSETKCHDNIIEFLSNRKNSQGDVEELIIRTCKREKNSITIIK